jgi:transcription antitermination factor NusG
VKAKSSFPLRLALRVFPRTSTLHLSLLLVKGQPRGCDSSGEAMASCSESLTFPQIAAPVGADQIEHWYALQTRVNRERVVERRLQERGVRTFLPLFSEVRRWSDRKKVIQFPLFRSYLFAKLVPSRVDRLRVLCVEGVFNFVGPRGEGTAIPDAQIEAVRALVEGPLPWCSHPFLKIGQRVRIRSGALDGVEGILVSRSGESTLVISVDAIQRSMAVRIEGYDVEAV